MLHLRLIRQVLQIWIVCVHEDEHALDVDVLHGFDVQNWVVLLAIFVALAFAVGPDSNLFVRLAAVVYVLVICLLAGDQLGNLREAAVVSLVRAGAVDVCQVLSQFEPLAGVLLASAPSLSHGQVVLGHVRVVRVQPLIREHVAHLCEALLRLNVVTQVRHVEVNRRLRIGLHHVATHRASSQVTKRRGCSAGAI